MKEFKEGDIFRWKWTDSYSEKLYKECPSTVYWCMSRIAVCKGDRLVDTYWSGCSSSQKSFSFDDERIELEFVANFEDLTEADPSDRAYYLDKDCVDLNHPNSTRGNFYIRKGAEKNLEKMQKVMKRDVKSLESEIKYLQSQLEYRIKDIEEVSIDSYIRVKDNTSLEDYSYLDEV